MNENRHIVVESEELYHYGVKGMKWKDHVYAATNNVENVAKAAAKKVSGAASAFTSRFRKKKKTSISPARASALKKLNEKGLADRAREYEVDARSSGRINYDDDSYKRANTEAIKKKVGSTRKSDLRTANIANSKKRRAKAAQLRGKKGHG